MKRYAEGETTLRKALTLDQHSVSGWFHLARVLAIRGQAEEAEQALKQAEKRQPTYSEPNRIRAEWLRQQGKHAEALLQIKESIRKYPGLSYTWNLLGHIEYDLGNTVEASRAFATALRLERANADSKQHLAGLSVAAAGAGSAAQSGQPKNVSSAEESNLQLNLGLSEMQRGRLGAAEDAIRKALVLSPKSTGAWNGLGSVLLKANRLGEADDAYSKAIDRQINVDDAIAVSQQRNGELNRQVGGVRAVDLVAEA